MLTGTCKDEFSNELVSAVRSAQLCSFLSSHRFDFTQSFAGQDFGLGRGFLLTILKCSFGEIVPHRFAISTSILPLSIPVIDIFLAGEIRPGFVRRVCIAI